MCTARMSTKNADNIHAKKGSINKGKDRELPASCVSINIAFWVGVSWKEIPIVQANPGTFTQLAFFYIICSQYLTSIFTSLLIIMLLQSNMREQLS